MDGVLWLARVYDKARAAAEGTIHDYIYPCPMDKGVMEHWGITPDEFNAAIAQHPKDDAGILRWLRGRASGEKIEAANMWLTHDKVENLDRQDAEEGAVTA